MITSTSCFAIEICLKQVSPWFNYAYLYVAISTQELKTQMKSLKLELKSWEHDFLKEKGRKPQKDDILQDRAIAKKYKQYGKLKQQAAERSLNEGGDFGSDDDLTRTNGRKSMNRGRGETNGEPLEFGKSLGQDKSKFVSSHLDEAVRGETSPVGQYEGFEVRDLDKPTEPVEILQNPNLAFRSNHPLLKNLSFIPAEPIPAPEEVQVQKLNLPEPRLSQVRQKRLTITNEVVKTYDNPLKQCHPVSDPQLFKRVALGDVLRCKIIRKNAGLDSLYPTFYLLNEADEKFLLAARKRKKAKNSHYIVSSDIDNLTKESKGYVAKIKADSSNLSFTVYDARSYAPAQPHKGLRDMCAIAYDKSSMPRDIKAAIRPPSMPDDSKVKLFALFDFYVLGAFHKKYFGRFDY